MLILSLDQGNDSHNIKDMLFIEENIYMIIKVFDYLEGEYGKPISHSQPGQPHSLTCTTCITCAGNQRSDRSSEAEATRSVGN